MKYKYPDYIQDILNDIDKQIADIELQETISIGRFPTCIEVETAKRNIYERTKKLYDKKTELMTCSSPAYIIDLKATN